MRKGVADIKRRAQVSYASHLNRALDPRRVADGFESFVV
jgi:hypothetical protein